MHVLDHDPQRNSRSQTGVFGGDDLVALPQAFTDDPALTVDLLDGDGAFFRITIEDPVEVGLTSLVEIGPRFLYGENISVHLLFHTKTEGKPFGKLLLLVVEEEEELLAVKG